MAEPAQGQVWWANLPKPSGWRPVLVLTRSDAIPHLLGVTVAPISRTVRGLETEVTLNPADGLPSRCVVSLDAIATIDRDDLIRILTTLPTDRMNEVWEALHVAFDLPF